MSMFGNSSFGQNNNQQQQPQQSAFGQPSAFGSSGFNAFAQNQQQQQQQPQVNPMFGNPSASSSNSAGGFGAFAGGTTGTSAFGKPAFGSSSGAFGNPQPSAFAGTPGAFGNASTSGGAFGPSAQQNTAFGSNTSTFGKPQTSAFGATALTTTPVPATGTLNPPYQEIQERENVNNVVTTAHFQSIVCMPAYRNASFEELRVADYSQGRKTAGATGQSFVPAPAKPFGTQPQTNQLFGSSSSGAFGAQPQQNAFSAFGSNNQQQQPATGFAAFANQQNQSPFGSGTSAFNNPQPAQGGFSAFASQSQPNQQQGPFNAFANNPQNKPFGTFASNQTNQTPFSAFANNNNNNNNANPSPFGIQQPQQTNAFSAFTNSQTQQPTNSLLKPSVFGPSPSGGLFANQNNNQQQGGLFPNAPTQQQQGGLFSSASQPNSSPFGPPTQQQQGGGGIFNQPANSAPQSLFTNAGTNQQNTQQSQQQQQPGGGFPSLFTKPATPSLFANTQQPQNPNPSNPLFNGGGGFFANNNNNNNTNSVGTTQQQPSTNPLFGPGSNPFSKPATTLSPFSALGGGGIGTNTSTNTTPGLGIFGSSNAAITQPQSTSSPFGPSIFGAGSTATATQQAQGPKLTASIDQPLPGTGTPSASIPPLPPLAASLNSSTSPKKKTNVFADFAARPAQRVRMTYTPPSHSLRGFGASVGGGGFSASSTRSPIANPFAIPLPASFAIPTNHGRNANASLLSPEAFTSGAGGSLHLLGGARQSVKKLVLDRDVDGEGLTASVKGGGKETAQGVRFNPALSVAARERDNQLSARATASAPPHVPAPPPVPAPTPTSAPAPALDPKEGEYWCLPTVAQLQQLSFTELQSVVNFKVGRVGYGTIQFLESVDLTSVPSIADIPGKIITFEPIECTLYTDERLKPPAGEGLNVRARIKLDRCWAVDKSTREPIKDAGDRRHLQRLRKMKNQEGTEFVSFTMETGVWEFIVHEF